MKPLITILLAAFLLAACSAKEQNKESQVNQSQINQSQNKESQVKESIPSVEAAKTEKTKSPVEEKPLDDKVVNNTETNLPIYRLNEQNWGIQRLDGTVEKNVLLTIDDAPDQHALEMAKILHRLEVKAIFFVNGHFLDTPEEEAVLKQIHEMGFPIGNHTYSHATLPNLTDEEQKNEIVSLNERVRKIIGVSPVFFRAPYGMNTVHSKETVAQEGMLLMNWSYGYDWEKEYQTPESLAEIMIDSPYLTNGANLLMHDRSWTKEALEEIVKGLEEKGYLIIDPALIDIPNSPNER